MSSLQKSKSLSLQAIRAESRNRDLEERIRTERRRNTLVLILRFLVDHGYTSSYEKLTQEAALSLKEFDACDNIFLYDIVAEFENFYEVKYGRKPKDTSPTPEGFWVDKRGVEEWDPDLDNSAAGQNIGEPSFAQSLPTSGESSRATCAVVRFLSRL